LPVKPLALDIRIRSMMRIAAIQSASAAVVDGVVEGIVRIDRVGRICQFNSAAERIFGHAEAELLGRNVSVLMPSPDRERHDDYLASYVATGLGKVIGVGRRVNRMRRNGEIFPMQLGVSRVHAGWHCRPIRDLTVEEPGQAAGRKQRFLVRSDRIQRHDHFAKDGRYQSVASSKSHRQEARDGYRLYRCPIYPAAAASAFRETIWVMATQAPEKMEETLQSDRGDRYFASVVSAVCRGQGDRSAACPEIELKRIQREKEQLAQVG
jgi:PAS domain S-box-containing protein